MASKSLPAPDGGSCLKQFGECAAVLRTILYQDAALSDTEFLFIENHFQVLQMAYLRWKRKHRPHLSAVGSGESLQHKAA